MTGGARLTLGTTLLDWQSDSGSESNIESAYNFYWERFQAQLKGKTSLDIRGPEVDRFLLPLLE